MNTTQNDNYLYNNEYNLEQREQTRTLDES